MGKFARYTGQKKFARYTGLHVEIPDMIEDGCIQSLVRLTYV